MDHGPHHRRIYASSSSNHGNSKWTVIVVREQALGMMTPPPLEAQKRFFGHADALQRQGGDNGVSAEAVGQSKDM